jgi:hypothetical protein
MYVGKVWLKRSDAKLRARGRRLTSAAMKLQKLMAEPYHLGDGWRRLEHPTKYIVTEIPWPRNKAGHLPHLWHRHLRARRGNPRY